MIYFQQWKKLWWKKRSEKHKHWALAVVRWSQKISPHRRPLPGAQDSQTLISWRWSPHLPANPVLWGSIHAILSSRGNRPTNTHTNKQTHWQDRLQYTAPLRLRVPCKNQLRIHEVLVWVWQHHSAVTFDNFAFYKVVV